MIQSSATTPQDDPLAPYRAGAANLVRNCVGAGTGDRILLVGEQAERAFFDPAVCDVIAKIAKELGAVVSTVFLPPPAGPEDFPDDLSRMMDEVDHTIFLSRIGDQIRFCGKPGRSTKTMVYLWTLDHLASPFARVPHGLSNKVHDLYRAAEFEANTCRITCPEGTNLEGPVSVTGDADGEVGGQEFSVAMFPKLIAPPIPGDRLNGRLALSRWLFSTSTHVYEGSQFELKVPIMADVENGRIVGFDGPRGEVARVEEQFRRVAGRFGGDPFAINSWHAGLYPQSFHLGPAATDPERWAEIIFGSPRYLHVHACGNPPGDIAISLIDPSVSFDDVPFWKAGRFVFLGRPEIAALLDQYPEANDPFAMRMDIGV